MAVEIRTEAQLNKALSTITLSVLDDVLENMRDALENCIEEEVYSTYEPMYYERTYDFRMAWEVEKAKIIGAAMSGEIDFNPDLLDVDETYFQHTQAEQLAELVYNGYPPNWTNAVNSTPARNYWNPFITIVNDNFRNWVKEGYIKRGLVVL